ncbi:2-succinyl-6-hydroxy-2,4-cyclohexadiene-1-carboxylate synthase [Bacillus sp. DTU_2020_1000418_1_SI_GHA_SEK_038]|uniref:2-succinyl-6-hydroxy-2, 4-cyclohexadiene-1-carboxylate synthase n=1 Tax=Bacillus sp. DTU_2020_1000418_1_SI_GHA_SEK_038 TaxID=3077585 RepID=UPI0028E5CE5F|nr:2-succinyl-6-hydroxy-2,4-cyclohexadiene-1-carboxylate synthase [Bacillus sp. DTU_2020_1000418_1_SI_GHA_SEK_038]WNS74690.1 2-succinyl-6-hydroxy-2,4-cyclohexadiene-1-carboxylate synthase [Bacillus sp. DTU_2020_1000418_1_SI_GHA_SEK_038]
MNFVINGIQYYVDRWGSPDGTPLILLHGFTGSGASWKRFEPYWKNFNVFAVDIIGHGKTDSPEDVSKYDIESVAGDLQTILHKLGIVHTNLLGYSMGGRLALTFSLKYPQLVRKLILESSTPGLKSESEREARRLQDEKLACRIQENGIAEFVDYWENIPLFQSQKMLSEDIRQQIRNERLGNSVLGLSNSLRGMGTGTQSSWWERLHELSFPVLLITGELDTKFCRIAKEMHKTLKDGNLLSIDKSGHAIHVEKPDLFGTIVNEFLSYEKDPKNNPY